MLEGLKHTDGKVRAACALLLDHVADDRCIEPLTRAMRHAPQEAVRRCAMHALVCDGYKECPLNTNVVGALIEAALKDRSVSVRRRAVFYLSQQRPEARAREALEALVASERDGILLQCAHRGCDQSLWSQSLKARRSHFPHSRVPPAPNKGGVRLEVGRGSVFSDSPIIGGWGDSCHKLYSHAPKERWQESMPPVPNSKADLTSEQ